jgi:D-beta-D-heptose 7-phosphate kinase / D-beta-D-heptose 1-phosphate adenosyltransferase
MAVTPVDPKRKIIDLNTAAKVGLEARESGRTLVFTNGCFDILHAGHIKLLTDARNLGDSLMVGLNTDASVRALKGEGRPVVDETARSYVLAALEMVDWVVLFDEFTPLHLIEAVVPKILVKGGDYTRDSVVGHEIVEASGGMVVIIPLVMGYSTTRIIEELT